AGEHARASGGRRKAGKAHARRMIRWKNGRRQWLSGTGRRIGPPPRRDGCGGNAAGRSNTRAAAGVGSEDPDVEVAGGPLPYVRRKCADLAERVAHLEIERAVVDQHAEGARAAVDLARDAAERLERCLHPLRSGSQRAGTLLHLVERGGEAVARLRVLEVRRASRQRGRRTAQLLE